MKSAFYDTSINVRFKSCKNIGHQWQYIDNGNDDRLGLTNSHNVALRQCYPWNKSWRTCQIEKEIEREKEREKKEIWPSRVIHDCRWHRVTWCFIVNVPSWSHCLKKLWAMIKNFGLLCTKTLFGDAKVLRSTLYQKGAWKFKVNIFIEKMKNI